MAMHTRVEETQTKMLGLKTSADMAKLMSDTLAEITAGFLDSAKKANEKMGDAVKMR